MKSVLSDTDLAKVFRRVGLDGSFLRSSKRTSSSRIDQDSQAYLSVGNPRLRELISKYSAHKSDALHHSHWTSQYVAREVELDSFRQDSAYMWQQRDLNLPINYLCTYYQICQSEDLDLLMQCQEDEMFGVYSIVVDGGFITRDKLDSVCELSFLRKALALKNNSAISILDIGSGYGRLAHRVTECFQSAKIYCVDAVPESTFLCEFYLNYRNAQTSATVVPFPDILPFLENHTIDVAVAINSLSECSARACAWWFSIMAEHNVPYIFLVPNAVYDDGRTIMSTEIKGDRSQDISELLLINGYSRVLVAPKYKDPLMQTFGVSPTYYHLFARRSG